MTEKVIYVVEDDPDIGIALEHLLSDQAYCPCVFVSITDFHARAKPREAVCVIIDIQMDGAGFDLKRQLSLSDPELPIIFMTGSDTEENRSTAQQLGAAAYLPKPFGVKTLLEAIQWAERLPSLKKPVDSLFNDEGLHKAP
jgi:FixJ family two-component response regulator